MSSKWNVASPSLGKCTFRIHLQVTWILVVLHVLSEIEENYSYAAYFLFLALSLLSLIQHILIKLS